MTSRTPRTSFPSSQGGLTRREFLRLQALGAVCLAGGAAGLIPARPLLAETVPDLAVVKGAPAAATRAAVELLGGMKAFVKPGQKVVIKPNFSFANPPEAATTTHPEVVRELVVLCREAGAGKISVLDHTLAPVESCLTQSGIPAACDTVAPGLVRAVGDARFFKPATIAAGVNFTETAVMEEVLEADALISAPVAKSHSSTGVSLSMKNMMGLIHDRRVMHSRYDINEAIVDLVSLLRPNLCVVDATRVLTTNGPAGPGKVERLDTVVASRDMVAADAQTVLLSQWYGRSFEPGQVRHIRLAHDRGLGRMDVAALSVRRLEL